MNKSFLKNKKGENDKKNLTTTVLAVILLTVRLIKIFT